MMIQMKIEQENSGIVHFSTNMLEFEAEIVVNEADNDTLNKKWKQKLKKQYKWQKGNLKKLKNLQFSVTMNSQKMIIWVCIKNGLLQRLYNISYFQMMY